MAGAVAGDRPHSFGGADAARRGGDVGDRARDFGGNGEATVTKTSEARRQTTRPCVGVDVGGVGK
jgi:hypothetical protein